MQLNGRISGSGELSYVLLHGLFGSLENLGGVARGLSEYYRVHSLDLRNHGRSPHSEHHDYQCMTEDVIDWLDRHDLQQCWLLGHSMGGKVAMTLALKYPARVAGLVVADIAPVQYPRHHDAILTGLESLDLTQLKSREQANQHLLHHVPELPVRQFLLKNLVKEGAGGFRWRINLKTLLAHYPNILAGQSSQHPYSGPTLFIKGGTSDYILPAYRAHTAQIFPRAQLKIIPATGHWLHAEKPELFTRLVRQFTEEALSEASDS